MASPPISSAVPLLSIAASTAIPNPNLGESQRLARLRRDHSGRLRGPVDAMGMLDDKKILVTGLLSNRSIAYGIARACAREGAGLAFTYVNDDLKDRVVKLAAEFGTTPVLPCDVTRDDQIAALFERLGGEWGGIDGVVHAIAFAPREALSGDFLSGLTRE